MSQSDEIIQLQKDVRSLSKKLERSEKNRTLLEHMWDRNSRLFQTLNTEIEQQRELIQRQHRELELERQKSENLLLNILPHPIAQRLKEDQSVIADHYQSTTVLFTDIVDFTKMSESLTPYQLVRFLNRIFSSFDSLVEKYRLEKIKTVGDAYMVAGGLPEPRPDHVEAIADFALEMRESLPKFHTENNQSVSMRTGIHTGPAVAGVIGTKKFIYDVWGDTVNTASRMESHGVGGEIQVSEATYKVLKDKYILEKRGMIEIKGKGRLTTYWLQGKNE
ncbi:MAG: adenylate/guanylate cyclase domain-containing protein [Thermodesulfobacteriota bacterium]